MVRILLSHHHEQNMTSNGVHQLAEYLCKTHIGTHSIIYKLNDDRRGKNPFRYNLPRKHRLYKHYCFLH
jgi:predicted patatin/cPLA2 family phospholipase